MDEEFIGVAMWGNEGELPTAVVLAAGSNAPLLSAASPGTMFGASIVVDRANSNATHASVFFGAAGKAVHANAPGFGGDAYAWQLDVARG